MKNWSLTLVMAAAVLSLQACDVEVHDKPQAAATSEPTPTPSTPDASTNVAAGTPQQGDSATPAAPAASAAPDSMAAASASTDGLAAAPPPGQTSAMGAPAAGSSTDAPAMGPTTPDGVAAPTELGRFLQDNPIGGSAKDSSANPDAAKAGGPSAATKS